MSRNYRMSGILLLALTSAVAMLAMTSAVASATPTNIPMWSSGGTISQFGISNEAGGKSIAGLNLQYVGGGVPIGVTCETLALTGKVENPAANKPGTLVNASSTAIGPSGSFQGCLLVKYGEKEISEGLECTIPKELPMESNVGTLTNEGNPAGGLSIKTYTKFTVQCPSGYNAVWSFTLSGVSKELWSGNEYFSAETTKVEGLYAGSGEASYGIGLSDSKGAVTIAERAHEEPFSSFGTHWYRGGAERNVAEGLRTLLKEGTSTSLTGGAASVSFESVQAGVKTVIACSSGSVTGSVENPAGGGSGVASTNLGLSGCAVTKPEGKKCSVVGAGFTTKTLQGVVQAGTESDPVLELKPSGEEIASFTLSGCTVAALNHVYTIKGRLFAKPQMKATGKAGSWSFPASLNSGGALSISGQKGTTTGEVTAETGGEVVTMG
jgi:hypothetical protein